MTIYTSRSLITTRVKYTNPISSIAFDFSHDVQPIEKNGTDFFFYRNPILVCCFDMEMTESLNGMWSVANEVDNNYFIRT